MRVVGGDGVGRLLDRPEAALHMLQHEVPDPPGPFRLDPGRDVHEHEGRGHLRRRLPHGHHRRHPAERRAHHCR